DHRRVRNFLELRLRSSFFVFLGQEKIADQILGRFGFAKIDNRVELQLERFVNWIGAASRNHAERPCPRSLRIGWSRRFSFRRRNFSWRTFSFTDQASGRVEQLLSRYDFVDQT